MSRIDFLYERRDALEVKTPLSAFPRERIGNPRLLQARRMREHVGTCGVGLLWSTQMGPCPHVSVGRLAVHCICLHSTACPVAEFVWRVEDKGCELGVVSMPGHSGLMSADMCLPVCDEPWPAQQVVRERWDSARPNAGPGEPQGEAPPGAHRLRAVPAAPGLAAGRSGHAAASHG